MVILLSSKALKWRSFTSIKVLVFGGETREGFLCLPRYHHDVFGAYVKREKNRKYENLFGKEEDRFSHLFMAARVFPRRKETPGTKIFAAPSGGCQKETICLRKFRKKNI
jgi:hypothetical protein